MSLRTIARIEERRVTTVGRLLATLGLPGLKALVPKEPVVRYEQPRAGRDAAHRYRDARLHRSARPSSHRRDPAEGAGRRALTSPSTIIRGLGSCKSTPTSGRRTRSISASVPVAHYSTLGMLISEFWPVTAASVAPASLPVPAKLRASSTASPGPDRRKPTARPSASSRPACANGPTPEAMPTAPNALPAYLPSWSITTVGDLIQPSATNLQLPATAGTTYCYLTNS